MHPYLARYLNSRPHAQPPDPAAQSPLFAFGSLTPPDRIMREHCAFCGAQAGEPCRGAYSGAIMAAFHRDRMKAAKYLPTERKP